MLTSVTVNIDSCFKNLHSGNGNIQQLVTAGLRNAAFGNLESLEFLLTLCFMKAFRLRGRTISSLQPLAVRLSP